MSGRCAGVMGLVGEREEVGGRHEGARAARCVCLDSSGHGETGGGTDGGAILGHRHRLCHRSCPLKAEVTPGL